LSGAERAAVLSQALDAARSIRGERARPWALEELAPHLPAELLSHALDDARSIADEGARSNVLAALPAHLPEAERAAVLSQVFGAALSIGDDFARYRAQAALAPHLPADLLSQALDAARSIVGGRACSRALAALAPRLATLPLRDLSTIWVQTLPVLAARTRPDVLADLHSLLPVLAVLAGHNAPAQLREVARAITDIARWWP
jgi:hypothetical protein